MNFSSRQKLNLAALWIVVALALAQADIYPFFSWRLFSDMLQYRKDRYSVRMGQCGGKVFKEPVDILSYGNFDKGVDHTVRFRRVEALGDAISFRQMDKAKELLNGIVNMIVDGRQCSFLVFRYQLDAIDAVHGRPAKQFELLKEPRYEP